MPIPDLSGVTLSENLINAVKFEEANRAHGSVTADDSFYIAPQGTADAEPGTLLKLEETTDTSLYTLPSGLAMSRFIYQSLTSSGAKVPVSALVLWPYAPRAYADGVPVVGWSHGTSGICAQSAPSNIRNLWQNFQFPFHAAQAGYAVVCTDYAGLGVERDVNGNFIPHEYLGSTAQARDLLYSIPAARQAFPELSRDFVLVGHSQGGGSVWNAAQQLAERPVEGHLGTVALAPVTRFLRLGDAVSSFMLMIVPALESLYADFKRTDVVLPGGIENLRLLKDLQGSNSVMFQLPNTQDLLKSDFKSNKHMQQYEQNNANGGKPIRKPLLVIQGEEDELIGVEATDEAVYQTAKAFPDSRIEYHKLPFATHESVMYASSRVYMDWIADRFARKPTQKGVKESVMTPLRPGKAYQANGTFVLTLMTEPWQAS